MSIGNATKGVALGVMGLAAVDLFTATQNGPKVFGTVLATPVGWLTSWLDPTKPLIPDISGFTTGSSSGGSGGSSAPPAKPDCAGLIGPALTLCQAGYTATSPTTVPNPTSLPPAQNPAGIPT